MGIGRSDWALGIGHRASGIGHRASGIGHRAYLTTLDNRYKLNLRVDRLGCLVRDRFQKSETGFLPPSPSKTGLVGIFLVT
ncbi:hypothetical protein [Microcoleus sp. B4-D4]|uniref:hypothetical protein n=1 Tax=Microcoleus sp. B4-D4 TaxID=2818667 RepID=UPI002FD2081D